MKKLFILTILIVVNFRASAQYILGAQNFESSPPSNVMTYKITGTGGVAGGYTGMSPAGFNASNSPFYTDGNTGYGLCATSRTIDFDPVSTNGFANVKISFNLAAFDTAISTAPTFKGLDFNDYVILYTSTNGVDYVEQIRVTGRDNAIWEYSATGVAAAGYSETGAFALYRPSATQGLHTTDGYSKVELTSVPSTSTVYVRIVMSTSNADEMWVVDKIQMTADQLLPVEMTSFTVANDGTENNVKWVTALEDNVKSFSIERGKTANNFEQIGSTNAMGAGEYNFTDKSPLSGVGYYRIKTIDNDGKYSYSKVVSTFLRTSKWEIYPTLASNNVNIARTGTEKDATIEIYDNLGRKVIEQKIQGDATNTSVDVSKLSKGMYFIMLDEQTQRFSKM